MCVPPYGNTHGQSSDRANDIAPLFRMYTSDGSCDVMRVQWHRFEPGSSMHPLIQMIPHVAFKVNDLDRAVAGYKIFAWALRTHPELSCGDH